MSDISLLFAVEAEQLLLAGMPEEAIELCNQGLLVYPGYAAAISVLVRAYSEMGNAVKASKIIDDNSKILPANSYNLLKKILNDYRVAENDFIAKNNTSVIEDDNTAVNDSEEFFSDEQQNPLRTDYQSEINDSEEFNPVDELWNDETYNAPISDYDSFLVEEYPLENEPEIPSLTIYDELNDKSKIEIIEPIINIKTDEEEYTKYDFSKDKSVLKAVNIELIPGLKRFEENKGQLLFSVNKKVLKENVVKTIRRQSDFMSILTRLSKAENIKPDYQTKIERNKTSVVITDTIAGILEQQGSYQEAKNAYLELIKKYPNKESYYIQKISEIDSKIK